jgi:hypothetical protein
MNAIAALKRAVVGVTATILALAWGVPTPAEAQTAQVATLYQDINYGGANASFFAGNSYRDLANFGWNDRASSIRVSAGTVVAMYSDIDFGGRCETFRADDADLRNNTIGNDAISSLRIGVACPVVMWNGTNYTGGINWTSADIPDLGIKFSNLVSSLKVQGNKVALYDLPNYGGLCENFTADDPDLNNNPIVGRASSLRIGADCPKQAVLFADINYGGDFRFVAVDNVEVNLEPAWADRASSVHVTAGTVLDTSNSFWRYTGTSYLRGLLCQRFTASNPDLRASLVLNDGIDRVVAYDHTPEWWERLGVCPQVF